MSLKDDQEFTKLPQTTYKSNNQITVGKSNVPETEQESYSEERNKRRVQSSQEHAIFILM